MRYLVLLVLFVLPAFAPLAAAEFSPWDAWRLGYTTFEKGIQLRDKGDYVGAVEQFNAARRHYVNVQKARPDWNQSIIQGRINDCDRELNALKKLVGSRPAAPPAPRESSAIAGADFVELQSIRQQAAGYKQKLFEAMTELEELRRQVEQGKTAAAEIANLLRDQRIQQEKYALLEKRYHTLEQQALEPDGRIEELRKQLLEEKLNSEVAAKRLQVAEARIQKLDRDAAELFNARGIAEAAARQKEAEATRLERELAELRRFQEEAVSQRSALQFRLDQAEKKLKEATERDDARTQELAQLRGQLREALKSGGDSVTLNAQLLEESRKLRKTLAEMEKNAAAGQDQNVQLQNRQRELQLELVRTQETATRLEALRARLETECVRLRKEAEQERSAAELSSVELKNLRERSRRLESDLQNWSERCAKLEKRLETRNSEDFRALAAADGARKKLADNLAAMESRYNTAARQVKELTTSVETMQKELNSAKADLKQSRASTVGLEQQLKSSVEAEARLRKELAAASGAAQELQTLRTNFEALRKESEAARKNAAETAKLKTQLAETQKELALAVKAREQLGARQKENLRLTETVKKLRAELAARPTVVAAPAESGTSVKPAGVGTPEELIAAGKKAEAEESVELAIWNYRTALELAPGNPEAAERLGRLLLRREEFERALPLIAAARKAKPDDPELAADAVEAMLGLRQYDSALTELEPLLKRTPRSARLLLAAGRAFAGKKEWKAAETRLREAAEAAPRAPAPQLELARLFLAVTPAREADATRSYQTARDLGAAPDPELEPRLGKLLDERRAVAEFMLSAAREAEKSGDWTSAAWYYRNLLSKEPDSRRYSAALAFAQYMLKQYPAALETLAMHPDSAEGKLIAAMARFRTGDFPAAEKAAAELFKSNRNQPLSYRDETVKFREELDALLAGQEAKSSVNAGKAAAALRRLR